jgi:general secretion pathway protein D
MVQDHRTAVIGGLLSNEADSSDYGIPFISNIPVLGNLFSDKASDKTKLNLLVFLTPHVIRTRDDLRFLALDERRKFTRALGPKQMHQMPMEQYKQLYQPTFSHSVPPSADVRTPQRALPPSSSSANSIY